jgi:hypothetical protein
MSVRVVIELDADAAFLHAMAADASRSTVARITPAGQITVPSNPEQLFTLTSPGGRLAAGARIVGYA